MAYKRELIINNSSLTSYKKILKVSDACQLVDKKRYPAAETKNGVTFTNNEDGTVTLNGTATAWAPFLASAKFDVFLGHKYLLYPNSTDVNVSLQCGLRNAAGVWLAQWLCNSPTVFTLTDKNVATGQFWVGVEEGKTVSNVTVTPQAFDLTEMYGAGNEPATVAEFKAKFPNDLYDYSPRCWVTSYKTGLIAKTKNLFNINALTAYTPETLPGNAAGRYNGNIITKCASRTSIGYSGKLLKELCPNMVAGERYILHFDTDGTWHQANTIYLYGSLTAWTKDTTHVVTEAELNGVVAFYGNYPSLDVATISNFQIEKGTTTTEYTPYGYL